jgi:hypothetical protein
VKSVVTIIEILLSLGALIVATLAFLQTKGLKQRFVDALGDTSTDSLEATLRTHLKRVEQVDQRLTKLNSEYQRLSVTNSLASQKISIVRFNPFGDTGGDQSFALAVLDAQDSGYVLTSIHGRQGTRVYVKPVDYGKSKYTLSAEEQQSLDQAVKRVPPTNQHPAELTR